MRHLLVLVVLVLTACTDFPEPGACGNGIVEPALGEGCDDGGDTDLCSDLCEVKCLDSEAGGEVPDGYTGTSTATQEPRYLCPPGFACGVDEVCRAPSNAFHANLEPFVFDVDRAELGDVNNDGIADLIGVGASAIRVRYGAEETPLFDEFSLPSPRITGQSAIVDLDGDDSTDLAVPVVDGVTFLKSDDGYPFPELVGTLDEYFDVGPDIKGAVVVDSSGIARVVTTMRLSTEIASGVVVHVLGNDVALNDNCGGPGAQWDWEGERAPTVAVSGDRFTVTLRNGTSNEVRICSYTLESQVGDPETVAAVRTVSDLDTPLTIRSLILGGSAQPGCLDLIVAAGATESGSLMYRLSAWVELGECTYKGQNFALIPLGRSGLTPLLSADLDGDGTEELVTSGGVHPAAGGSAIFTAPRRWNSAVALDTSGDGWVDVVASAKDDDDIDVVRFGAAPGASSYLVNTSGQVRRVVGGDFDGDGIGDVAISEGSEQGDLVSITYGRRDSVMGDPIAVALPGGESSIAKARVPNSDAIDDLMVMSKVMDSFQDPPRMLVWAATLIGNAARLPTTYLPVDEMEQGGSLSGIVAGALWGTSGVDLTLVQIAADDAADGARDRSVVTFYPWLADGAGSYLQGPAVGMMTSIPATNTSFGLATTADRSCFVAVSGSVELGAHALLTGLSEGSPGPTELPLGDRHLPRRLHVTDLDRDGASEIVVATNPLGNDGGSGDAWVPSTLSVFSTAACDGTGQFGDADIMPALRAGLGLGGEFQCIDMVALDDGAIALLCAPWLSSDSSSSDAPDQFAEVPAAIFRLDPAHPETFAPIAFAPRGAQPSSLLRGDVDGDGVQDLLMGYVQGSVRKVQAVLQCPTTDTDECLYPDTSLVQPGSR
jgi:hypothetical protein